MSNKLPNNLRALRKSKGLTLKQVAALTGLSLSSVQKHETGERDMDTAVLGLYEKCYKVSKNQIAPSPFSKNFDAHPVIQTVMREQTTTENSGYVPIYELDMIMGSKAGSNLNKYKRLEPPFPIPASNLHEVSFSAEKNLCIIRVFGDSMEPTLTDGCRVVVDVGVTKFIKSGIYIIWDESGINIKRLQSTSGGRLQLLADNKNYPVETVLSKDIVIKGKVVLLVSKAI